jgi:uridine kinase
MAEHKKSKSLDEIENTILMKYESVSKESKHLLVGISGIDASGKSTFANYLEKSLRKKNISCFIISGDDFFFKRKVRYANPNGAIGYYQESCNYKNLLEELLIPLKKSKQSFQKIIKIVDWKTDTDVEVEYFFQKSSVVIVEGVFLFKKGISEVFDYKIWMDLSFRRGVKRAMRRERDIIRYGSAHRVKERYLNRLYRAQLMHLEQDKPYEVCHTIVTQAVSEGV